MKLYVGNLAFETTEEELRALFTVHGDTTSAYLITDRETGGSRGFGFVEMTERADGERATEALNGSDLHGRAMTVSEARPKSGRR